MVQKATLSFSEPRKGWGTSGLVTLIRVLLVLNGHLSLAVRAQPPEAAVLAHVRELLAETRGDQVGERHAVLGLIARVAEHDTLVTGANVHLVLANVHAAGNVRALLVDADLDLLRPAAQALRLDRGEVVNEGVVADALDSRAHDLLVVQLRTGGDLAEDHDHVVLARSLASDLALRINLQACVEHGIRNLIRELIRVALVHGLRREEEGALLTDFLLLLGGH